LGLLEQFYQTLKDDEAYCRSYEKPRHALRWPGEFQA